jgi:AcrR family transcriptional regulator
MGLTPQFRQAPGKRQRILLGMLEAVGSVGYEAASVRTVLDRSGLGRQAFHDNFADKGSCYLEAFDFGVAQIEDSIVASSGGERTWRGRLRAGLGALLDFLDAEPDVGRALVVEVHAAGGEALAKRAAAMQRAVDFVSRGGAEGSEVAPAMAAAAVVAGIHATIHTRLATGVEGGFRPLLPEFLYFAVLPYFGSEVARAELEATRA